MAVTRARAPLALALRPQSPSQDGTRLGSSFVLGAPLDPEQQAAHLERQGREQQERLLQERLEADRQR